MAKKTNTIYLKGNPYAQVKERIKAFREDTTRGSIATDSQILEDGSVLMKAHIVKDLSDEHSARATGQALGKVDGQKAFEKLETIAVGRALAFMGYMADGAIASSEEMEEFEGFKRAKIDEALEKMEIAKDQAELKKIFLGLGPLMAEKAVIAKKDELKAKLPAVAEAKPEVKPKAEKKVAKGKKEKVVPEAKAETKIPEKAGLGI